VSSPPIVPSPEDLLGALGPLPALDGGTPVRDSGLPVALPWIGEKEKQAVAEVLESGWMTTGPRALEFGRKVAELSGATHGLAVNSCTGALHLGLAALGIRPGDEVITSTWTFCSTINVILHMGARPVLVDIEPDTLNLDPAAVAAAVGTRTRAILPVHFAGHPAEMDTLLEIARQHRLEVIEDAAHALGARYHGRRIGSLGHATCFSFYAIKNITTGEGGALVTPDEDIFKRAQILSLHGISKDAWKRYESMGSWYYEVVAPGFKYNLTDMAAAIGLVQLERWPEFHARRHLLADRYDAHFATLPEIQPLAIRNGIEHARHIYPVLLDLDRLSIDRSRFIEGLRAENIGTTVNFIPIHLHPYYRDEIGYTAEQLPVASSTYPRLITLPLYPRMQESDVDDVVRAVFRLVRHYRC
jgi:dTDP-4-amino-4,6-dideoxygalactose transaminase